MTSSWLSSVAGPDPEGLLAARPDLASAYAAMLDRLWRSAADPALLELCRVRVAQLVGDHEGAAERRSEALACGLDEETLAAVASWPIDTRFGRAERVALGVAEQFVLDPHGITDEQVVELERVLGRDQALTLVFALAAFDGLSKLRTLLLAHDAAPVPEGG